MPKQWYRETWMAKAFLFFLLNISLSNDTKVCSDDTFFFPNPSWEKREPESVGMKLEKLDALRDFVGGRGCVIRHGSMVYQWGDISQSQDVASACKPVLSTLLCFAIQEGLITNPDEPVARFEPRIKEINQGKDAGLTWRHLASQTACYGWAETPGTAWAYNDHALALYYDTLMNKVFQMHGDAVLKKYLAGPLQFEDSYTFEAFGPDDRPGRLALSVRDFARFGYFILRKGRWNNQQLLQEKYIDWMLNSIVPAGIPGVSGKEADMIPGQRSIGGGKNITPIGPGFYSFNWWLNGTDRQGNRLWVDAPVDTFAASGHGGIRAVWIIPSLDLIVSWNDSHIDDHDDSPGNSESKNNQALRLIMNAIDSPSSKTTVTIQKDQWFLNEKVTYPGTRAEGLLMNVRMVNTTFEDRVRPDFDSEGNTNRFIEKIPEYAAQGVRAFTLNLQGGMPGYEGAINSAFEPDGNLRPDYMNRIRRVIYACDQNGCAVILGCFYQRQDQILRDETAVQQGVVNILRWIERHGFRNVLLEIANEFNHDGFDHSILKSPEGEAELIRLAKQTAPQILVSSSGLGDGRMADIVADAGDFILIHFNGTPVQEIPERIQALKKFGKPIVCNEDDKTGEEAVRALEASIASRASWGYMNSAVNQYFPLEFRGIQDDPLLYARLRELTTPR